MEGNYAQSPRGTSTYQESESGHGTEKFQALLCKSSERDNRLRPMKMPKALVSSVT